MDQNEQCTAPNILLTINNRQYCRPPCESNDQTYSTQLQTCVPVNCREKYGGLRDFFNAITRFCEPVVPCSALEAYDALNNICVVRTFSSNNTDNSTRNTGSPSPGSTRNPSDDFDKANKVIHM